MRQAKYKQFNGGLFLLANGFAIFIALLIIIGFDVDYYRQLTEKVVAGSQMTLLEGQGNAKKEGLLVTDVGEKGFVIASSGQLDLDSQTFTALNLKFNGLNARQPLTLIIHYEGADVPLEKPIAVSSVGSSTFDMDRLFPTNTVIYEVWIATPQQVINPFVIKQIEFQPKAKSINGMLALLEKAWTVENTWSGTSINIHGERADKVILNAKVLILGYSLLLFVCFFVLLFILKKPKAQSLWLVLVLAWFIIDGRYFQEQLSISHDSYERYYGKGEKANHAMVAPDIFVISDKVNSAISQPKSNIWLAPPISGQNAEKQGEYSDYITGRLNYFLTPHSLYTGSKTMPLASWQQGGFYLLVLADSFYQFQFEPEAKQLSFVDNPAVSAEQLINEAGLQLYYIQPTNNGGND